MKVKNIMFSGVMAAILGATGAHAAISVASQGYVDSKIQGVETSVENITNNYLTKEAAADTYATTKYVTENITNVLGNETDGLVADVAANTAAIATKANADDVYTKTEADNLLASKADLDDVYQKTQTYTQDEVKAYVSQTLTDIGEGNISLEGYAKTQDVNNALDLKADKTAVDAITESLAGYATDDELAAVQATADAAATKTYVDTEFAKYTTTEGLTTTLSEYAKQADLTAEVTARETAVKAVDDKLADYTKTSELDAGFVSESEMTSFKTDNSAAIEDAKKAGTDAQATADANAEAISGLENDLTTKITMPEVCATTNCVLSTIGGTVQWVPLTEPLQ